MKTFSIDKNGKIQRINKDKNYFVSLFDLNIRDLRPIFSPLQVVTILPRKNCLIVNFGSIKAILTKDKAYLFGENEKKLNQTIQRIQEKIKNKKTEQFYLSVLENILDQKVAQMQAKIEKMKSRVENTVGAIKKNFSEEKLEELLFLRKKISRLKIRLQEIISAIKEVLDEEDDFTELVLVEGKYNNSGEAESILENFLEQIEDQSGQIFKLEEYLEDVHEFIDLKFSQRRTAVVKIDLFATVVVLIISILTLITGLYGMNIKNGLENSETAFKVILALMIFFFLSTVSLSIFILKKKKLL